MDTGHSRRLGHTRGRLKLVIDSRVRPMSELGSTTEIWVFHSDVSLHSNRRHCST
jgi:hypothetical protein